MTVVYHLETHRNPRQIEHLVRTLVTGAPGAVVVVDHDARFEPPDPKIINRLGAILRLSSGGYGDMSHVRRWLTTARWLQKEGIRYDWLSNLTGQDYPVRRLSAIHADLAGSRVDAYVQSFDVFDPDQTRWGVPRGRTRYEFQHRRLLPLTPVQQRLIRPLQVINVVQPWVRLSTSVGLAMGTRATPPWGEGLVLKGGSFFCTLNERAVNAVLRFTDARPDVGDFLSACIAPDEVYIQTALGWAIEHDPEFASLRVGNDCRRYFDFSASRQNHPKTLSEADLPVVVASGADFARKFDDAATPGILDRVDELLYAATAAAAN